MQGIEQNLCPLVMELALQYTVTRLSCSLLTFLCPMRLMDLARQCKRLTEGLGLQMLTVVELSSLLAGAQLLPKRGGSSLTKAALVGIMQAGLAEPGSSNSDGQQGLVRVLCAFHTRRMHVQTGS